MREIELESGKKLKIEPASWGDAINLHDQISKVLLSNNIDLGNIEIPESSNNKKDLTLVNTFIKAILSVSGDQSVRKSIFKCLQRCLYDGEKITEEIFEDAQARKDYYPIIVACITENISPLLEGAFSGLKPVLQGKALFNQNLQQK